MTDAAHDKRRYVTLDNETRREALWTWTEMDDGRVAITVCEGDRPVLLLSKDDVRMMKRVQESIRPRRGGLLR